jgi:phosphohistidine phosphatase SixA
VKIALIRHGDALDHQIDEHRQLSELGQQQVLKTAQFLSDNEFDAKTFFHSPLKRAIETCHIITSHSSQNISISESGELKPMSSLSYWLHELNDSKSDLALVGHNPFMSLLAQELTEQPFGIPTGGCLILEKSEGALIWKVFSMNF